MKVRDVLRLLRANGFTLERQTGSHRQLIGVVGGRRRLVTVAGQEGDDIRSGTLAAIRRQSGLPRRLFR
ncbi:MAG: type II toxin-antitoxin system HicA family toxin [bacterium]|nr:type II toxin-antitoxin system HicA family toxin [bacterium]MDE0417131.1 type II toxin-antitoxin system HicA family toxin [bacterium]